MLVQNAFTALQFGVGIVVISHKRPLLFAVIPCVVSCRARSTFCSAAAMLSAAAALLDPVSCTSHLKFSHSLLTLTLSGSGCSDVRTIGPTPLVPRNCTPEAHTICT